MSCSRLSSWRYAGVAGAIVAGLFAAAGAWAQQAAQPAASASTDNGKKKTLPKAVGADIKKSGASGSKGDTGGNTAGVVKPKIPKIPESPVITNAAPAK